MAVSYTHLDVYKRQALVEVIDLDETFKNTGPVFFRNADSGVSHTDLHFIFFRLIKDCNTPFACEFDRIIDEIGYYLSLIHI